MFYITITYVNDAEKYSTKNQCGLLYSLPAKSQFSSFPDCQAIPTLCQLAGHATSSPRKQSLSCVSCHANPLCTACDGSMHVTQRRPEKLQGKSEGKLLGKQINKSEAKRQAGEGKQNTNQQKSYKGKKPKRAFQKAFLAPLLPAWEADG